MRQTGWWPRKSGGSPRETAYALDSSDEEPEAETHIDLLGMILAPWFSFDHVPYEHL
jgi:hypothetical protein